jgi:mannose-6-phosphate isomerase-like protein (cupin superfamily)
MFMTKRLAPTPDVTAPDGSDVRVLLDLPRGSLAHFSLGAGETSIAVRHRTVEEIWYVVSGSGQMWRQLHEQEETVDLEAGVCLTIPTGAAFQFRSVGPDPLAVVGVTMPPWPGEGEAIPAPGPWSPTLASGRG